MSRLNFLLVAAVLACALLLITSQYKARKLVNELELEQEKTKQLDIEWGQLQLEQSTWAVPGRVEKLARERLHMLNPDPRRTVVVPINPAMRGAPATPNAGDNTPSAGVNASGEGAK
jgi:cell division protein FtsL